MEWSYIDGSDAYTLWIERPDQLKYVLTVHNNTFNVPASIWDPLPLGDYHWKVLAGSNGYYSQYSDEWTFTKIE